MRLLQFADPMGDCHVGVVDGDAVLDLTSIDGACRTFHDLCYLQDGIEVGPAEAVRRLLASSRSPETLRLPALLSNRARSAPRVLKPVTGPAASPHALRIWLAGVTHQDSARLREIEAQRATGRPINVYDQKYCETAAGGRPELFPKCDPESVVGHGQSIARPSDTVRLVPEPELVSVYGVAASGDVVRLGYTGGNDVTDNGMEALNPLNLPQAKNWSGGCASMGSIFVTADEFDARDVEVSCEVARDGRVVARKAGRTGSTHLNCPDAPFHLERMLFSRIPLQRGQLQALFWGAPVVFGEDALEEGLLPGDEVRIEFSGGIGRLENPIAEGQSNERALSQLREDIDR